MPASLGTFTVSIVVGGAVDVVGRAVATVAGAALVAGGAVDPGAASSAAPNLQD
jgi:hypothetical protein